jgi:hypothetical protein
MDILIRKAVHINPMRAIQTSRPRAKVKIKGAIARSQEAMNAISLKRKKISYSNREKVQVPAGERQETVTEQKECYLFQFKSQCALRAASVVSATKPSALIVNSPFLQK